MINLRNAATAILFNGDNCLLIKRSPDKLIAPNVWSGVGGHMEPHEINNPLEACYRELMEEAGIPRANIHNLKLLYIIMRRSKNEIRQHYCYFGETSQTDVIDTDEGKLFWIPKSEILDREYTKSFTAMMEHYVVRDPQDEAVYVGVTRNKDGEFIMKWSKCEDFE